MRGKTVPKPGNELEGLIHDKLPVLLGAPDYVHFDRVDAERIPAELGAPTETSTPAIDDKRELIEYLLVVFWARPKWVPPAL